MLKICGNHTRLISFIFLGLAFYSLFKLYISNTSFQAQGFALIIAMQCLILSKLYSKGEINNG